MTLFKYLKNTGLLLLVISQVYANDVKQNDFDSQRPNNVSDKKWSSLKAVVQEIKLLPTPDDIGGSRSNFGYSVAIDGNRALVGANLMIGHGVVYVLEFDSTNWIKTDVLTPSDEILYGYFGSSVSLSGDRAIVGAYTPSSATIKNQGFAYIYDLVGGIWEETKILASDGAIGDEFGVSVSLSGDRALVGAYKHDSSGAAYLYDLVGVTWQQTKLVASDRPNALRFGYSVSLEDDRAVIGAYSGKNSSSVATGSVHVFDLVSTNWIETKITPTTGVSGDAFGRSVSLFGDRMLIGSTGDDDNGSASGSAYVFEYNSGNTTWEQKDKIIASNGMASDSFGFSVTLDNDRALVGAYLNDLGGSSSGIAYFYELNSSTLLWDETTVVTADDAEASDYFGKAVGLSGDVALIASVQNDDLGGNSGSVYFLDFNTGNWDQTKVLGNPGPAYSLFGYSVSLDGDRAVVGAQWDNDKADNAGAVYVYDLVVNNWVGTKILASDGEISDTFGESVSLLGNRMLIGASGDDDKGNAAGAAYVFDYNTTTGLWDETIKLKAINGVASDHFGSSVSLSLDRLIIGAYGDDQIASSAGAVYVYDLDGSNNWIETKLTVAGASFDNFGYSVSIEGNRALIGSPYANDGNGVFTGAAFVFDYNSGMSVWEENHELIPIGGQDYAGFGVKVSLSGDRILVGAEEEGNDNTGMTEYGAAYVFDYNAATTNWDETVKLVPAVGSEIEAFGYSLDLEGDKALVGGFEGFFGSQSKGVAILYNLVGANWVDSEIVPNIDSNNVDFGTAISLSGDKALVSDTSDFERGTRAGAAYVMDLNAVIANFKVSVNVTGLGTSKTVTFENNSESLVVSDNIQADFLITLADAANYTVSITSQPTNQTCFFTSGNQDSAINGLDVVVDVYCNSKPTVMGNSYTILEDMSLLADDIDGSVLNENNDGIFVNDTDPDGDVLVVQNPGTYTIAGVGGEITIAQNGSFSYVAPANLSGSGVYFVSISDGMHSVSSLLAIEVLPVNDAPTFSILGDVLNASSHQNINGTSLTINQFASDISVGPDNENSQSIIDFSATIASDPDSVLVTNGVTISEAGHLNLNFTTNPGTATVQLVLKDNGGTNNNGQDTSQVVEFNVSYLTDDGLFSDGFESP